MRTIYTNTISEEYVASAILKQPEKVIPMLKAEGFTEEYFHTGVPKLVWKTAIQMIDDGKVSDIKVMEHSDEVRGIDLDGHLYNDIVRFKGIWGGFERLKNHVKTVKDYRSIRFAEKSLSEATLGLNEGDTPEMLLDALRATQEGIMAILQSQSGWKDSKQQAREFHEFILRLHTSRESAGTPSGMFSLDQATGGLSKNELWVVGAQTSGGKTVLMLQIMANFIQLGKRVLMFSLETESNVIHSRIASNTLNINMGKVFNKSSEKIQAVEVKKLEEYIRGLEDEGKVTIVDEDSMTLETIMATSQQVNDLGKGIDLIVVDYIQLVTLTNTKDKARHEQVAEVTRTLKQLAKRYKCPVITATQLNDDGKARESRAITHDADVYLTIGETSEYVHITKNRNGERDITLDLRLDGAYQRFA